MANITVSKTILIEHEGGERITLSSRPDQILLSGPGWEHACGESVSVEIHFEMLPQLIYYLEHIYGNRQS